MTLPANASELEIAMAPLNKDERREHANAIAMAFTQRHPLGTNNTQEMMLLRHAFVCLPTSDIEKYIGTFALGITDETRTALYLGQDPAARAKGKARPPFWASTCRMLQSQYNKKALHRIFQLNVSDVANANAQVFAGLYTVAYEKQWYGGFKNAIEGDTTASAWLQPFLFDGMSTLPDESKIKIWMLLSHLKDEKIMSMFTQAMGWEKQWALAESLLGDNLFTPDHKLREIALRQLVANREKSVVYELPPLDLAAI